MPAYKYTKFDYEFGGSFAEVSDSYSYVKLPYRAEANTKKILFVLDFVPTEDLKSGKLLSGETGDLMENLFIIAKDFYLKDKYEKFSWLACSFNAFKTLGKSREFQEQAREAFTHRVEALIMKYKPDVVVAFGASTVRALIPKKVELSRGRLGNWYGVPVKRSFTNEKDEKHKCVVVPTLSLNSMAGGDSAAASVLGYIARNLANALHGKLLYPLDTELITAHKSILIDTIPKFDKMLDMLKQQPVVSIDTEDDSLAKVTNRVLTFQFAKCMKYGYVVPYMHKDTPFDAKELLYIKKKLCAYFEGDNNNDYHIYANAQFDLNVMRIALGTRYMANDVWDIFSGEYGLDENMKFLQAVGGDYYYSLGNISSQYGFEGYLTAAFGKEDRKNIARTDLDDNLVRYMTLDVILPFGIHLLQKQRALVDGHKKYESLIRQQMSDLIHGFSRMETTGSGLDVNYLFHLRTPASPIEKEIEIMTRELLETPAVKKTNKLLLRADGVPEKMGSWAAPGAVTQKFSLRADAHKKLLFFKVLGLEPLDYGKPDKDGKKQGKLDKNFQSHYKNIPEVKMYTSLGKAKKLKNAYVNSFLKLLASDADFKSDYRIRPNYKYLVVVTGRTSAADPNLQQIPARSELGKHIKRLFVARPGFLYIKVDYRVHEVRGWGIIAFDKALASVFIAAKALRDAFRLHPSAELAEKIKYEADVHVVNLMYFFRKTLAELKLDPKMMKELRNAVKGVIFGLIYQMSIKSLAASIGQELDFTKQLVTNFNKRFPSGMGWIEKCKKFAQENLFFENPLGFRRRLWGYLMPKSSEYASRIHAEMDRRAVNSPIQGMCSQFMAIGSRQLDKMIWQLRKEKKRVMQLFINNSVHDSLENEVAYKDFLLGLEFVEQALTKKVREEVMKRHGFDFVVDLEIDFEIGASLSQVQAWDFSVPELERIVKESLEFQRDELGHEVKVNKAMKEIFSQKDDMAPWMQSQIKNIKYKFEYEKTPEERAAIAEAKAKAAKKAARIEAEKAVETAKAKSKEEKKSKEAA